MINRRCLRAGLPGLFGLAFVAAAVPQNASKPPTSTGPGISSAPAAVFRPGLDDLMTMLIQPRHHKLYLAGSRQNWELAAFQALNLRRAFARISQFMPKYLDIDVEEATRSILDPKLDSVDAAIAAGNLKQFAKAYEGLTTACNACHAYMEHGYLLIKVPASSASTAYPAQEFSVTP